MVKVFNSLNVKVSCLGNHDLDFGIQRMTELVGMTKPCKWLISNLNLEKTGRPVGDLATWTTEDVKIDKEGNTMKVGFFGVAEREWLGQFSSMITDKFTYRDYITTARELSAFLRKEQKCDFIIALTHMRVPNDRLLAENVQDVDLCLGGHDHSYIAELCDRTGVVIVKSGTDFEEFSDITVEL